LSNLISILIPNYNKALYLKECLNSVLAQTYSNWECIIVDDHSTDRSWEIIEDFYKKDSRFKIFVRPDHLPKGGNVCRNYAINISKGDYCIFLDSDDVLADCCLEQRMRAIVDFPENDFWVFRSLLFTNTPSDAKKLWNISSDEPDLVRFLRMDALWQTTGPIYKKSFIETLRGFDEKLSFWQDFELHIRSILAGGRYIKLFEMKPDVYIREGDKNSLSRSTPFTADKTILNKRISIYENFIFEAETLGYDLNNDEKRTVFSVVFYFSAQLWLKHGDFKAFRSKWKKINQQLSGTFGSYLFGLQQITYLKLSQKVSFLPKVKTTLKTVNADFYLDFEIMTNSQLGKVNYPIL
jgi:glycosyltransferase involved in cell wall biosynthesis